MGPLTGFRIIEIAGIGPGPFCGMLLADMGADIIRIERPGGNDAGIPIPEKYQLLNRGRPAITADLKTEEGRSLVLRLCEAADALFEGNRPGVMERLGVGPDECLSVNPKLVYGRMTGWGQDGPLAHAAGHDGNYAAVAGALGAIGSNGGPPVVPLNLVADFGGGGAYLAIGILAALLESQRSGQGQVVDAAMVDGAVSLMTLFYGLHGAGMWNDERGDNLLDGAAPFYRPYRTKDGRYVFVGAIEPQFFAVLLQKTGVDDIDPADQLDRSKWPEHIGAFDAAFASKAQQEWVALFEDTDGCVSPVLSLSEAPDHPHNLARNAFVEIDGVVQPAPAPRFSRTSSEIRSNTSDKVGILRNWGITNPDID